MARLNDWKIFSWVHVQQFTLRAWLSLADYRIYSRLRHKDQQRLMESSLETALYWLKKASLEAKEMT